MWQNGDVLICAAVGTYIYHWAIKIYMCEISASAEVYSAKEKQKTSWNVNCSDNRVVSALVNSDLRRSTCIYFAVKLTLIKIHADVLRSRTYPVTSRTANVCYVRWHESVNKSRQTLMLAFMKRCVEKPLVPQEHQVSVKLILVSVTCFGVISL